MLRRGDGVPAYNLAVVVDDAAQGVDQVVRGDDLLSSSPRQAYLGALLGHPDPVYAHVPLVLNADGEAAGQTRRRGDAGARSVCRPRCTGSRRRWAYRDDTSHGMLAEFDPARLPRSPWIYRPRVSRTLADIARRLLAFRRCSILRRALLAVLLLAALVLTAACGRRATNGANPIKSAGVLRVGTEGTYAPFSYPATRPPGNSPATTSTSPRRSARSSA